VLDLFITKSNSPIISFTDSPNGDYPNYYNAWMQSKQIDLQITNAASLSYWTKWDIESQWDFATLEISTNNGVSWQNLSTPNMVSGSGDGVQTLGVFGYDGTQSTWIEEKIDISAYAGNIINLRFNMLSDSWITEDGWYIDDIKIFYYEERDTTAPVITNVELLSPPYTYQNNFDISATVYENNDLMLLKLFYKTGENFIPVREAVSSIPGEEPEPGLDNISFDGAVLGGEVGKDLA